VDASHPRRIVRPADARIGRPHHVSPRGYRIADRPGRRAGHRT